MDTSVILSITGAFYRFVGELLADLKRQELAMLDAELLRLKRMQLAEKLEEFEKQLASAVITEKGKVEQELISRGLATSTVRQSELRAIDQRASDESEKAHREYSRAIEEIALLERKVAEQSVSVWKRIRRFFGL
jgi:hypothetical protein